MKEELTFLILFIQEKKLQWLAFLAIMFFYRVKDDTKVLLPTGKKVKILGGVYTDEKLDSLIGSEKSELIPCGHASKINKLEKITKLIFRLNELDNSVNLEDDKPSNTLFTYHVTEQKDFTSFEPVTPQYKKLKNELFTSLTLRIMDQDNDIIANRPGATIVLHIRDCK